MYLITKYRDNLANTVDKARLVFYKLNVRI